MATRVSQIASYIIDQAKADELNQIMGLTEEKGNTFTKMKWRQAFVMLVSDAELQEAMSVAKQHMEEWGMMIDGIKRFNQSQIERGEPQVAVDFVAEQIQKWSNIFISPYNPDIDDIDLS